MDAPIYESLLNYKNSKHTSFHTPGHKGAFLKDLIGLDFTELPCTDDLYNPKNSIKKSYDLAKKYFKTKKTLFSSNGSTLCIQTMLGLALRPYSKIICARNLHKSALNTIILLGLNPVWIYPKIRSDTLCEQVTFLDIKKALNNNPDAAAVYLTSPDYYGFMCDVKKISLECKKKDVPLLVDNAHGSFLFCSKTDLHPIKLGASMCTDSAHKTLPALTPGAFLHINDNKYAKEANLFLSLFGSTSPSFPVLASLDLTRRWMQNFGEEAFSKLVKNVEEIKSAAKNKGFITKSCELVDPTRVIFFTASVGINGHEFANILRKQKIEVEFSTDYHVILIPSAFNKDEDFKRLLSVLNTVDTKVPIKPRFFELSKTKTIMTPQEAFFKKSKSVSLQKAKGMVASRAIAPCPPGIPILIPGEEISKDTVKILSYHQIKKVDVIS